MELTILKDKYSVYQFTERADLPSWICKSEFYSITGTRDELSVVAVENPGSNGVQENKGWKVLRITEPLEFSLVGVIAGMTSILKEEGIPVFVISTYNTDYILVKNENLSECIIALEGRGHKIIREG
jgi:hypothetical protein